MEFRKNEWWGKIIRWNFFDFNCFFPTNPDSIVDITQSFITMKSKVRLSSSSFFMPIIASVFQPTFLCIIRFRKKRDSKNIVSHSINICLSKNKGFKASNFSLSAIKSCEISRVKIWCVKIVMYERNSFHRTGP